MTARAPLLADLDRVDRARAFPFRLPEGGHMWATLVDGWPWLVDPAYAHLAAEDPDLAAALDAETVGARVVERARREAAAAARGPVQLALPVDDDECGCPP